jgi:hypothetical protein
MRMMVFAIAGGGVSLMVVVDVVQGLVMNVLTICWALGPLPAVRDGTSLRPGLRAQRFGS